MRTSYSIKLPNLNVLAKEQHYAKQIQQQTRKYRKMLYPILFDDTQSYSTTQAFKRLCNDISNKKGFITYREDAVSGCIYDDVNKYDRNKSYAASLCDGWFPAGSLKYAEYQQHDWSTFDKFFNWLHGRLAQRVVIKVYNAHGITKKYPDYVYDTYDGVHPMKTVEDGKTVEHYLQDVKTIWCSDVPDKFWYYRVELCSQDLLNMLKLYNIRDYKIVSCSYWSDKQHITTKAQRVIKELAASVSQITDPTQKFICKKAFERTCYGKLIARNYKYSEQLNVDMFTKYIVIGVWIPAYAKQALLDICEQYLKTGQLVYTDTDSAVIQSAVLDSKLVSTVIGAWKPEMLGGKLFWVHPKKYADIDVANNCIKLVGILKASGDLYKPLTDLTGEFHIDKLSESIIYDS